MTPEPTAPAGHDLTLRVVPMPADLNGNGDVFGGWVMAQVDIAGGIAAARRARGRVATVAVNAFQFKQPVSVGDVLSFFTRIESLPSHAFPVGTESTGPNRPVWNSVASVTGSHAKVYSPADARKLEHKCVDTPRRIY